jgi:hypothetical protein
VLSFISMHLLEIRLQPHEGFVNCSLSYGVEWGGGMESGRSEVGEVRGGWGWGVGEVRSGGGQGAVGVGV